MFSVPSGSMSDKYPRLLGVLRFTLIVICPLLFFTDLTRNPFYTQIALINVLVPLYWLVVFWQAWQERRLVWTYGALDLPLVVFLLVCLLSWISSVVQHPGFA